MEEFLKENYFFLTTSVEILAAVTGCILLKKYKSSTAVLFIYFLVYSLLVDAVSWYYQIFQYLGLEKILNDSIFEKNYFYVTIFWGIAAPVFYCFYFYNVIQSLKVKSILKIGGFSFAMISLIILWLNNDFIYHSYIPSIQLLSTLMIILCVSCYFYDFLKSDKILYFYKSLNFYISSIILLWWLISTPLDFYELYYSTADWNFIFLKWQIFLFANIFMYSFFTFALIWCKPEKN